MNSHDWLDTLQNETGLTWKGKRLKDGFALGEFIYHSRPLDAPIEQGVICLRNIKNGDERWLAAQTCTQIDKRSVRLSGQAMVENSTFSFSLDLGLSTGLPAACLTFNWTVDRRLEGWEVCLACQGGFTRSWTGHVYPWEVDAKFIRQAPLTYTGVPAGLFYCEDFSLGQLLGIDPASDYLNPLTWTGTTGLYFMDGYLPPQYRVCATGIEPLLQYSFPMQLIVSDAGDATGMLTGLVKDWIALNHYQPEKLEVRSPEEALRIFLEGRRQTSSWKPGVGYRLRSDD